MGPIVEEVNVIWYPGRAIIKSLTTCTKWWNTVQFQIHQTFNRFIGQCPE